MEKSNLETPSDQLNRLTANRWEYHQLKGRIRELKTKLAMFDAGVEKPASKTFRRTLQEFGAEQGIPVVNIAESSNLELYGLIMTMAKIIDKRYILNRNSDTIPDPTDPQFEPSLKTTYLDPHWLDTQAFVTGPINASDFSMYLMDGESVPDDLREPVSRTIGTAVVGSEYLLSVFQPYAEFLREVFRKKALSKSEDVTIVSKIPTVSFKLDMLGNPRYVVGAEMSFIEINDEIHVSELPVLTKDQVLAYGKRALQLVHIADALSDQCRKANLEVVDFSETHPDPLIDEYMDFLESKGLVDKMMPEFDTGYVITPHTYTLYSYQEILIDIARALLLWIDRSIV